MTTPSRRSSNAALKNLVPSGSFLKQLLEDISGSGTPTVLHNRNTPQHSPSSRHSSNRSRRASSAWVGGDATALETRMRLRAADEARMRKTLPNSPDGTHDTIKPTLHLNTGCFDYPSSSSGNSTTGSSPRNLFPPDPLKRNATAHDTHDVMSDAVKSNRLITPVGGLSLPVLTAHEMQCLAFSDVTGTKSPLFFRDIDSDMSSTSSPTELPTSAISEALTDATTISEERQSIPSASGCRSRMFVLSLLYYTLTKVVAGKRPLNQVEALETTSKKSRTVMLPGNRRYSMTYGESSSSSLCSSIGDDNRRVIQSSNFTEKAPCLKELVVPTTIDTYPELSSFRPQAVDAQGVPPISVSPIRPSTPRTSTMERHVTLSPDETPSYASSLHLVDNGVSIYKKIHGDEWRDNSLCLYCFRQYGGFNRLNKHGYEACGRDEALESHYWESSGYFEED
jgi:hypothetical protein